MSEYICKKCNRDDTRDKLYSIRTLYGLYKIMKTTCTSHNGNHKFKSIYNTTCKIRSNTDFDKMFGGKFLTQRTIRHLVSSMINKEYVKDVCEYCGMEIKK